MFGCLMWVISFTVGVYLLLAGVGLGLWFGIVVWGVLFGLLLVCWFLGLFVRLFALFWIWWVWSFCGLWFVVVVLGCIVGCICLCLWLVV